MLALHCSMFFNSFLLYAVSCQEPLEAEKDIEKLMLSSKIKIKDKSKESKFTKDLIIYWCEEIGFHGWKPEVGIALF